MISATKTHQSQKEKYIIPTLVFVLLSLVFVLLFLTQRRLYYFLLKEDGLVEWLTFGGLFISSLVAFFIAVQIKKNHHYLHWFFIVFSLFAMLAGLEEISWGQRLFGIQSNDFFVTYNDQQETNLHNTFQGVVGIKTKHIALLVLLVYGVILPFAVQQSWRPVKWLQNKQLIIPPIYLTLPFLIATAFMFDFPSGMEEEIGEFMYSVCFVFFMMHNYRLLHKKKFRKQNIDQTAEQ